MPSYTQHRDKDTQRRDTKVQEELATKLWQAMRENAKRNKSFASTIPPFSFMDLADEMPKNIEEKKHSKASTNLLFSFAQNSSSSHPTYSLQCEPKPYVITALSLQIPQRGMTDSHVL